MANKNFDDVQTLMDYVYDKVRDVIFHEIYEFVMNKLFESIEKNVFAVYEPILYERRSLNEESQGLLNDWLTLEGGSKENHIMIIENTATNVWEESGRSLAELIEYGSPKSQGQPWLEPRKFIEPVIEELKASGDLERILQQSLDFLI
mgnify:FL=1